MNHTQRIAHVAPQKRSLTKVLVRRAVDRYLKALTEDIASGEWVDLPTIGNIHIIEEMNGLLVHMVKMGNGLKGE